MERILLFLLLLINSFYVVSFLISFEFFTFSILWIVFFIISLFISIFYLLRSKMKSSYIAYLSIAVLVASISSLGAYGIQYYLSNFMG
ncbi:hypothetical protein C8K15_14210 [Paenisporosarcina sp. OV554]|nr:hypothetical protein C8K15_14210 [Paenisporosarcina sp. OV554]